MTKPNYYSNNTRL